MYMYGTFFSKVAWVNLSGITSHRDGKRVAAENGELQALFQPQSLARLSRSFNYSLAQLVLILYEIR